MALLQNVIARGTHAARPAAGSQGVVYFETDTGQLFRDSGSAWQLIDATSLFATKGDLLVGTGSGTVAKLGAGTDTYVLTADSAQTDGIKWAAAAGGGALTELADNVVSGGATTTVSFTSISGSYTSLLITLSARADESTTDDYALVRFNADTGANYESQVGSAQNTVFSAGRTTGATSLNRLLEVSCATAAANMAAGGHIWIPHYADTTFNKAAVALTVNNGGTNAPQTYFAGGTWKSTAAVTQIDLIAPASGHWVSGSHFRLFGLS